VLRSARLSPDGDRGEQLGKAQDVRADCDDPVPDRVPHHRSGSRSRLREWSRSRSHPDSTSSSGWPAPHTVARREIAPGAELGVEQSRSDVVRPTGSKASSSSARSSPIVPSRSRGRCAGGSSRGSPGEPRRRVLGNCGSSVRTPPDHLAHAVFDEPRRACARITTAASSLRFISSYISEDIEPSTIRKSVALRSRAAQPR